MLSNNIQKGKQETQACLTFSGSQRGNAPSSHPTLFPTLTTCSGGGLEGRVLSLSPPQTTEEGLPPPLVCLWRTQQWLFFQSFRLKQTFCIEKIPAHLVSFLLLMASARTICGIKCHALMDRREKNDEKKDKGGEQGAAVKICNKNSFS